MKKKENFAILAGENAKHFTSLKIIDGKNQTEMFIYATTCIAYVNKLENRFMS